MPDLADAYQSKQARAPTDQTAVGYGQSPLPAGGFSALNSNSAALPGAPRHLGGPAGPAIPNPYDLGAAFAAHTGGVPTHALASQAAAGVPQAGAQGMTLAPPGQSQASVAAPPGPSPAQAGTMNAAAPGTLNGNPANGVPSAEEGFSKPPVAAPAPQPATPQVEPKAAPAPAPAAPQPAAPPPAAQDPLASAYASRADSGDAGAMANEPTASAGAAPSGQAAAGNATGQSNEPATSAGAAPVATVNHGGVTYNLTHAAPDPQLWAGMSPQEKDSWLKKYGTPASAVQSAAYDVINQATKGNAPSQLDDLKTGKYQLPADATGVGGVVGRDATAAQIASIAKNNPGLQYALSIAMPLYQQSVAPAVNGQPAHPAMSTTDSKKLKAFEDVLGKYGITFGETTRIGPAPTTPPVVTPPSGPPPTTTPTSSIIDNNGAPVGGASNLTSGTSANVSNIQPGDFMTRFNAMVAKGMDPAAAAFALEMEGQQDTTKNTANNFQSGMNIAAAANDARQKAEAPIESRALKMTQDILDNPDPTDWETIKNQQVASSDASLHANQDALSKSFNRRGVGPAAGLGMESDAERQNANDKASALGQLDVQQSQALRAGQDNALAQAAGTMGTYVGGDYAANQQLAAPMLGMPAGTNPYEGAANAQLQFEAQQLAKQGIGVQQQAGNVQAGAQIASAAGMIALAAM